MIGTRIPSEWRAEIEARAKRSGRNVSQILHEAIAVYLGEESGTTLVGRVEGIDGRLQALERQISALKALIQ